MRGFCILNLCDNSPVILPSVLKPFFFVFSGFGFPENPRQSRDRRLSVKLSPGIPPFSSSLTPYTNRFEILA